MSKKVVQYARISTEDQTSVHEQLSAMQATVDREGWSVAGQYIDDKNYIVKGRTVNPSGERPDRPAFLEMLSVVETGAVDIILCWRDDRLVRHPRVAAVLVDALEKGDAHRKVNGQGGSVELRDATGNAIDRDYLQLMSVFWRKENTRRVERVRLGKIQTLRAGRWPGQFNKLGYRSISEPGKRGREIILADDREVKTVRRIFNWYDSGLTTTEVRDELIKHDVEQNGASPRKHHWHPAIVYQVLSSEAYTGTLTWQFGDDGSEYTIDIPQIITPEQFSRVQKRLKRNRAFSTRHARGVYLLQNLVFCGECSRKLSVRRTIFNYRTLADGTQKRYRRKTPQHRYDCVSGRTFKDEPHPKPYSHNGRELDWQVWRKVVDFGIKRPDLVRDQVYRRQAALKEQGDSTQSEIAHARGKLVEIDNERAFYQRQAARGKITEQEFDERMEETQRRREHWQSELERLEVMRDDAARVEGALDYAERVLTAIRANLDAIDLTPIEMAKLGKDRQDAILKERRKIIRALVERVDIWADGRVKVLGVLDGTEAGEFGLVHPRAQWYA